MGKFWPETDDLDWMEDAAIDQPAFFLYDPYMPMFTPCCSWSFVWYVCNCVYIEYYMD